MLHRFKSAAFAAALAIAALAVPATAVAATSTPGPVTITCNHCQVVVDGNITVGRDNSVGSGLASTSGGNDQVGQPAPETPSKTFTVTNDLPGVTAKVAGWTGPASRGWLSRPALGADLMTGQVDVWGMFYPFLVGNTATVKYSLSDAKTGAAEGSVMITMNTSAVNNGSAQCQFSGSANTCVFDIDASGTVQIFLTQA